mmetsp:Transcript_15040/g.41102  ORF Transcript_15040/g.41102 Transcript_15040/m.41102 type:complete len:213 (+) Transcript_15040:10-648(+)
MDLRGPLQSGAKQINAMMGTSNNLDVSSFSDALQKAAAATTTWTQNVIGQSGLDILSTTPSGVSGPLARDVGNVFEATFVPRKDIANEVSTFVKGFEKREVKYKAQIDASSDNLKQTNAAFEKCMARSENVEKLHEAIKRASKSVQTLIECESKCEAEREKARQEREKANAAIRQEFVAEINRKREEIEQSFKDLEAQLLEKYKTAGTEGFV